ncbi:hypothetical protein [Rhodococcus sp. ARC_M6]|uniref:hypothetical protein n=1 Tax=Rhodococcus sp. ARC_M6 TaxID=2928852 RepID=UPI001FB503E0|nr:hypothetical protein [Rhodococcus sp. ARC_M6]MCJ0903377.1 hypothetical protein [Rhodococcus sp. ARC_M6]
MGPKTSEGRARRSALALALGAVAVGSVAIVGCSGAVEGSPKPNAAQAADYQAEVTSSVVAVSSSKAAAAAADNALAICEGMVARSKEDVSTFNAYIDANNNDASDVKAKGRAAVSSADEMASWLDEVAGDLPSVLSGLFSDLADSLSETARVVERDHTASEINSITDTNNSIRDSIRSECGAL